MAVYKSLSARRAWIEIAAGPTLGGPARSLSARRAWIEIFRRAQRSRCQNVALRKESVDRNGSVRGAIAAYPVLSLSARRAWIEIRSSMSCQNVTCCRSPQGERG